METTVALTVNGKPESVKVDPRTLLVQLLRENLGLTGTHQGCDTAQCGACTVELNGRAVKSCSMLALQAQGGKVTTIEGLAGRDGELHPMQAAFRECHALAVRVLHAGNGDGVDPAAEGQPEADGGRDPRGTRGQHLPLHGLSQHRPRRAAGRRPGSLIMTDLSNSPIGKSIVRREDQRFITGAGQFTDDVVLPRQTYGVFVRSPHAHARIRSIDDNACRAAPGFVALFTGADLAEAKVGGLPCGWLIHSKDGTPMKEPPHPVLAQGKVRYVGDAVALVVAETLLEAKDAAERLEVDYEELPAVIDTAKAAQSSSSVHDDVPGNVCYDWGHGDKAAVDAAFAKAAKVTTLEFVNNRLIPNAMEPRAANATWSRSDDSYTLYVANQNPHVERLLMCAFVLGLPESKVRVIAPDVGGGFGSKIFSTPKRRRWSGQPSAWADRSSGRPSAARHS